LAEREGRKARLQGVVVKVTLSVVGQDPAEDLADLTDWLTQEPELRGLVSAIPAAAKVGELGVLSDALVVAVGGGGTVSVLAASLKALLAQPRRSDVKIVIANTDGRRVEIDARRIPDVEALVRQVCGETE